MNKSEIVAKGLEKYVNDLKGHHGIEISQLICVDGEGGVYRIFNGDPRNILLMLETLKDELEELITKLNGAPIGNA